MVLNAADEVWTARGAPLTFMSAGGYRCRATILVVRVDGTLDISVDAGPGHVVALTRVPLVAPDKLVESCCCRRDHVEEAEKS